MKKFLVLLMVLISGCKGNVTSSLSSSLSLVSSSQTSLSSSSYLNPYDYIHYSEYEDLFTKIENQESFIFVLASKFCSHCLKQEKDIFNYMASCPQDIYIYHVDDILDELENNGEKFEQMKERYRVLAALIASVFNHQEEEDYVNVFSTDRFNEGKEASLIYPVTFIYLNGELNLDLSYLGYGWSKDEDSYRGFVNFFKTLKGV